MMLKLTSNFLILLPQHPSLKLRDCKKSPFPFSVIFFNIKKIEKAWGARSHYWDLTTVPYISYILSMVVDVLSNLLNLNFIRKNHVYWKIKYFCDQSINYGKRISFSRYFLSTATKPHFVNQNILLKLSVENITFGDTLKVLIAETYLERKLP